MGKILTEEQLAKRKAHNDEIGIKKKKVTEENKHKNEQVLAQVKEYDDSLLETYQSNLKEYMENKKTYIAEQIQSRSKDDISLPLIMYCLGKDFSSVVGEPEYSAQELAIAFDYYQQVMAEINTKFKLPPTRQNFCAFIGIVSTTYDRYLRSEDAMKKNMTQRIEDYILENNWTPASKGTLNAFAVDKRTKLKGVGGGYTEAREDQNINVGITNIKNPEEMLKNIEGILGK